MLQCLGKVGEVIKVDDDGDLVVKFNGCQWAFNPMCCTPAPNEDVDTISLTHEDDNSDGMSLGAQNSSHMYGVVEDIII